MKLNLPSRLELSDVYVNEPFTIYEMENVFEKNIYDKLREEFPDKSFFTESPHGKEYDSGGKLTFNNFDPLFYKFLEQAETWKMLCQTINNEDMVNKLFKLMMPDLIKIPERKKFPRKIVQENIRLIQRCDQMGVLSKVYYRIIKLMRRNPVRIMFEFSRMGNDTYVPPHTEENKKIFNLLLYLPDPDMSEFDKNRLGTNFYKVSKDNLDIWDSYTMDENEAANFHTNYELFYKTKFSENKLIGLIKSSNSWHDTNKFNNIKEDRKSFNIFFYHYP